MYRRDCNFVRESVRFSHGYVNESGSNGGDVGGSGAVRPPFFETYGRAKDSDEKELVVRVNISDAGPRRVPAAPRGVGRLAIWRRGARGVGGWE